MAVPNIGGTWCTCDSRAIAEMYTEDALRHQVAWPQAHLRGRDEIAAAIQGLIDAVPDTQVTVRNVTDGGDGTVVVEWTFTGTHTNDGPGWPAAGEQVRILGISVCRMEGELIAEERVYWDSATFMEGAGMLERVYG